MAGTTASATASSFRSAMPAGAPSDSAAADHGQRRAEIPEFAGDAAVPQGPGALRPVRGRQALRDISRLLVVEGYMDVVGLAQAGIRYAVATLGTATTQEHLRRLFRVTERSSSVSTATRRPASGLAGAGERAADAARGSPDPFSVPARGRRSRFAGAQGRARTPLRPGSIRRSRCRIISRPAVRSGRHGHPRRPGPYGGTGAAADAPDPRGDLPGSADPPAGGRVGWSRISWPIAWSATGRSHRVPARDARRGAPAQPRAPAWSARPSR